MVESYEFRGRLSETTLPEMLSSIDRFQVAGIIEARHGDICKRIFIRDRLVVHASSSDRGDSLGEYLGRTGKLDRDSLQEISKLRQASNRRFGVLLIERELMTPIEVYTAIREHIEEIVWSLFFWRQGEVTFAVGDFQEEDMVRIQIPMGRVILEGIKRAPDARALVGRLGKRETVLEPCFRWEDLIDVGLDGDEYRLLMLVDARRNLYQLCSEGPLTAAENAKLLYAFRVLNLVRARPVKGEKTGPVKIKLDTTGDAWAV